MKKMFILLLLVTLMGGVVFAVSVPNESLNMTSSNISQTIKINMSLNETIIAHRIQDRYINMMKNRSEREHEGDHDMGNRSDDDLNSAHQNTMDEYYREMHQNRSGNYSDRIPMLKRGHRYNVTMRKLAERLRENLKERREIRREMMSNIRDDLKDGEELRIGNRMILRKIHGLIELEDGNHTPVRTKLRLNNEGNASQLKVRLDNGKNMTIKIMPGTASEMALKRLRLRVCNETINNCTIELKEVGNGNATQVVYEMKARKMFRLFRIFRMEREVSMDINAKTGKEIFVNRPWWSWLASEQEN